MEFEGIDHVQVSYDKYEEMKRTGKIRSSQELMIEGTSSDVILFESVEGQAYFCYKPEVLMG